jgi:CRISPR-associated endoribonuclease Cas6
LGDRSLAFHKLEFVQAFLTLEFEAPYVLTVENLLRLRRNLRQAARRSELFSRPAFDALFESSVAVDPYARRRYQRPGPPFVIHPPAGRSLPLEISGSLELPIVLLGCGIRLLNDFCLAFQALGTRGFHRGEGRFVLLTVTAQDLGGNRMHVWPVDGGASVLPVSHAGWFLDSFAEASQVLLTFETPARLMSAGRPLFKPGIKTLFPFILRRVTSMAHAYCDVELVDDPDFFIEAAGRVVELDNQLAWQDWRCLEGERNRQELGGVVGSVKIGGDGLQDISRFLRLGSLLNLGKGAAFGAGHFSLCAID